MFEALRIFRTASIAATVLLTAAGTLHAQDHGGGGGGMYWGGVEQAIAALIVFALLLAILGRWAWKPLIHQIRRREEAISNALERAEKREKEAADLLSHYQAKLNRAEREAEDVISVSRKQAAEEREEMIDAAKIEARKSADEARREIEQAKVEALQDLAETTSDVATEMAGRIIRRNLDPSDQRRLLDESMDAVRRKAAGKS